MFTLKKVVLIVFSMMLMLSLASPTFAERMDTEPEPQFKMFNLHMDYYGIADVWILHKVGSYTVEQAALRLTTAQKRSYTFTSPPDVEPGKYFMIVNLDYFGLYKIELNEEIEAKLLELTHNRLGLEDFISMSGIVQLGTRLDEGLGE